MAAADVTRSGFVCEVLDGSVSIFSSDDETTCDVERQAADLAKLSADIDAAARQLIAGGFNPMDLDRFTDLPADGELSRPSSSYLPPPRFAGVRRLGGATKVADPAQHASQPVYICGDMGGPLPPGCVSAGSHGLAQPGLGTTLHQATRAPANFSPVKRLPQPMQAQQPGKADPAARPDAPLPNAAMKIKVAPGLLAQWPATAAAPPAANYGQMIAAMLPAAPGLSLGPVPHAGSMPAFAATAHAAMDTPSPALSPSEWQAMLADLPASSRQSNTPEIQGLRSKVVGALYKRHVPDSAALMALIRSLASKGQAGAAEYWLQLALRLGVQATEVAFEFLISAFAKNNKSVKAAQWFNEMVGAGLSPSSSCFNTVLNACAKDGDVDRVEKLRTLAEERRWETSDGAYHAVVKMFVQRRDIPRAESWTSKMIADGRAVAPMTFNLLIDACAKAGESRSAEAHLATMIDKGCAPNLITYNSVINAFATTGGSRRAEEWVRKMSDAGIDPDEVTYGALCKAYARRGQPEKVQKVIDSLPERGMEANQYFYASLIGACARARPTQHLRAEQAFCEGVRRGVGGALLLHHLRRAVGSARAHSLCLEQGLDRGALEAIAPRED